MAKYWYYKGGKEPLKGDSVGDGNYVFELILWTVLTGGVYLLLFIIKSLFSDNRGLGKDALILLIPAVTLIILILNKGQ